MSWVLKSLGGLAALAAAVTAAAPAAAQSTASPYTSASRYDLAGRVTGTIAPDPDGTGPINHAAVRTTYDADGNVTKVEPGELAAWQSENVAPANWSGFEIFQYVVTSYDVMGRKTKEVVFGRANGVDTATAQTQYSYDGAGRLLCTAIRMDASNGFASAPSNACTVGPVGANGPDRITRNVYDAASRITTVQRAYGTALQQDYVSYTYTPNGHRASVTDANGATATYSYDGHDRLRRWNFPSTTTAGVSNPADYEEYGYDANGNRTSFRRRDGQTLTFQYDVLNRMTVKVVPERSGLAATHTRDVYYGYDLRGLQTYARYDSATGEGITNIWDGFGRQISTTLAMDGATRTLNFARNRNGARTQLTWMDGQATSYGYDGLNRLTNVYEGAVGSTVSMATFAYDNRGQVSGQSGRYGQTQTVGYDPVSRPTSLTLNLAGTAQDQTVSLGYNPASQIITRGRSNDAYVYGGDVSLTRTYTVNGLNQYLSAGPASFTYDANGNLTSDGSTTYVYDAENRLVSAAGGRNATLRYDPLGRLYETIGGGATTRFVYDGDELVAEYTGTGTLLRRYLHGLRDDDPVVWYEGAGLTNPRWLHPDQQGSIVAVSNSAGAALGIDRYDDWGVPDASNMGRFQYTGQAWLPELGMFYYKARIYSPTLGRFLQTDPIGYADQVNLYGYVGNDPIDGRDPTGLCTGSLIADRDGGCKGGGFINGAGSCAGQCTSLRDQANAFISGVTRDMARQESAGERDDCVRDASRCRIEHSFARHNTAPTLSALFRDRLFRTELRRMIIASNSNGPTSDKNESALWLRQTGNSFSVTGRYPGQRDRSFFYPRPPDSSIYFHIHPFTRAEGYTPTLSATDLSLGAGNDILMMAYSVEFGQFTWVDFRR